MSGTLLIVDDQELIRMHVRSLLKGQSIVDVCGEAKDGTEALEKVRELQPDIVLLDISMPRMNGLQAAQEIQQLRPSTKIVFFTIHPSSLYEGSASCAQAFVSKFSAETQLVPTLNRLLQTEPEGLHGPLTYQWQHSVIDAFASAPDSLPLRIGMARHAIAVRLTDLEAPDHDEAIALQQALRALHQLTSETNP